MVMPKLLPGSSVDAELEAALSARDKRRALTLLMARFGEAVYRYAVAMTRDRDLAEEVRQQVFVEAYRDLEHVAVSSALPTWIFGIARHRCFDAVAAQLRWNRRYKNEPPEDPELDDRELGRDLDRRELARILEACLAGLAPAARDAVVLRYQQELSYDEAAAIAGDLPGTLRRRVARALPVLRRCVEARLQPGASR
jgi:RNA polymerase sigma-70 factor (ECF subfamily)